LVSTRIATASINPVLDTRTPTTSTLTSSVVVNTTPPVVIDPVDPVKPNPPITILCNHNDGGGRKGRFEYDIEFGSNTGNCGISYDSMTTIPDRFTLIWDGNEYTTGFVGGKGYDSELQRLGYPTVVGPRTGTLTFNKTKSVPSKAKLIVDAPLSGTAWKYNVICPNGVANTPLPITTGTLSFNILAPTDVRFGSALINQTTIVRDLLVKVETLRLPTKLLAVLCSLAMAESTWPLSTPTWEALAIKAP
jgi:hypothetical protein